VPKLTGKYQFIKPLVETQRPSLGKIMASSCKVMLDLECEIRRRIDSRARMNGTYEDKNDLDEGERPRKKSFIPNSLRVKMPLNSSQQIQNDSRCGDAMSEVTTALEEARRLHEEYKKNMTTQAKLIADSEIKGRTNIQLCEYIALTVKLATRYVKVAKHELKSQEEHLTEQQITHVAINSAMKQYPSSHWEGLRFVEGFEQEGIDKFYKQFQSKAKINYNADILPAYNEANDETCGHSDDDINEWVEKRLVAAIPKLTTEFWENEKQQDCDKKLDAELAELDGIEDVDSANSEMENLMDVEGAAEEIMDSHIDNRVNTAVGRRTAAKKKAARKKSSGDAESQGSEGMVESTPRHLEGSAQNERRN